MELKQQQAQELIKQKFSVESYNEIMKTVVREHLQNINAELYELYNDVAKRIDLRESALKELASITQLETTELSEKIKNALWS